MSDALLDAEETYLLRPACKALIIQDGKVLTIKKRDAGVIRNFLPGGGQNWGENLHDALRREFKEEVDAKDLKVGKLAFVRESYRKKAGISDGTYFHKLEFIFECSLEGGEVAMGPRPDEGQLGIEWLDLATIEASWFFPAGLGPHLRDYWQKGPEADSYLGEIDD